MGIRKYVTQDEVLLKMVLYVYLCFYRASLVVTTYYMYYRGTVHASDFALRDCHPYVRFKLTRV